jgi:GrpB-like predicted nucleotidyltransferase (UPF0157 family)
MIVVEAYNPRWPEHFAAISAELWPAVSGLATSIEHVGSTSVPGLAAKPIIDIDIVIPDILQLPDTVRALEELGYEHRGNLGIEGREAFRRRTPPAIPHNLYVCPSESDALRNHLILRDTLRSDPELRSQYSALKYELAAKFPNSIDAYVEGKSDFILKILEKDGMEESKLAAIRSMNVAKK